MNKNQFRLGSTKQEEVRSTPSTGTWKETVNREKREANASKLLIGYSLTPSSLFAIHCP